MTRGGGVFWLEEVDGGGGRWRRGLKGIVDSMWWAGLVEVRQRGWRWRDFWFGGFNPLLFYWNRIFVTSIEVANTISNFNKIYGKNSCNCLMTITGRKYFIKNIFLIFSTANVTRVTISNFWKLWLLSDCKCGPKNDLNISDRI